MGLRVSEPPNLASGPSGINRVGAHVLLGRFDQPARSDRPSSVNSGMRLRAHQKMDVSFPKNKGIPDSQFLFNVVGAGLS